MKVQPAIIGEIQQYISLGEFEKAGECMKKVKDGAAMYDDTAAILDAHICEALGDREGMLLAIRSGLKYDCCSYELYDMLGYYYLPVNINQAYLCFQNALFHCNKEEDRRIIEEELKQLQDSGQIEVRNTAIIIVSYNAGYMMQKNVECIRQTLPAGTYEIVVVDNASDDGITQWLKEQKDIRLIENKENAGFPRACNQGVAALAGTKQEENDIFLLNNDTRLAHGSLFWLRMGLYERERIGATGSISNYAGNNQQVEVEFPLPADYLEYAGKTVNLPWDNPYEERVRLSGFAMLIRRNVWNAVGGFDEDFSPGYFEDDDLSVKISALGYQLLLCKNSFIYHAGSQSFAGRSDVEDILLKHHALFMEKHGFDILEYAYPDQDTIGAIPFGKEEEFNLLQIGSGLGADLKYLHTMFPKAHVIGIEPRDALLQISKTTEAVFADAASLKKVFQQPVFQVLLLNRMQQLKLSNEEWKTIVTLCRKDCIMLPNPMGNTTLQKGDIRPEQIKLVIWDLDQTFWRGILSEGPVEPVEENIALVKRLTDCGIVNSISSKNHKEEAMAVLKDWGLEKYFVFPDINWEGKGRQIRQKLEDMGLRAENVLFLDDDVRNLGEAEYYNKGIMTGGPDRIPELDRYISSLEPSDPDHKRLERYQILERKRQAESDFASKEQFLEYSDIRLEIRNDCLGELDRITELVARTNQLNYTKVRDNREEIQKLLENPWINKGYIKVKDRFGDYGIVGFYCFDQANEKLRHFLFSCRVIGMGIEQCIYTMLGSPKLTPVEPVAVKLVPGAETPWIHFAMEEPPKEDLKAGMAGSTPDAAENKIQILFKGPCDLSAIESYLSGGNIVTEFNYVNDRGFITTGQNHSMHIWESAVFSKEQMDEILAEVPFLTAGDFQTSLFQKEYHIICYSLLPDCHAGLYRNKRTGAYISFGSRNFDLTAPKNRKGYIDGTIVNHFFPFTEEILENFSKNWEFVGATSEEDLLRNLEYMYTHVPGKPIFLLFLGSEIEYEGVNEEFAHHAEVHKRINALVKEFAADKERIKIIEMTKFIHSQNDYEDCINHFSRNVYYDLATEVCSYINAGTSLLTPGISS